MVLFGGGEGCLTYRVVSLIYGVRTNQLTGIMRCEGIRELSEAPNDGFLLNTLNTLFRLSRVLLDL